MKLVSIWCKRATPLTKETKKLFVSLLFFERNGPAAQTNGVLICIFLNLFINNQEKGELTSKSVIAERRRISLQTIHWHLHQFQGHTHEFLAVIHLLDHQE